MRTLIFTLSIFFLTGCNGSAPTSPYAPVDSPETPGYLADAYLLNADSTVSLIPELSITPAGSNAQNELIMDIKISVQLNNNSDSIYTVSPGRATMYTYDPRHRLSTVPLEPTGQTLFEHPIPPDTDFLLEYTNSGIDQIIYPAFESEFYAALTLVINGIEIVFVTQIFTL